jgi:hypothetical protein
MTATIIANDPVLQQGMYLDKVNTYAKAHAAVKADEQASIHSKIVSEVSNAWLTDLNFVSTYKKDQKTRRPRHNGMALLAATQVVAILQPTPIISEGFHRGGTKGGYNRRREGTHNQSGP